jgi:hypothetical protein
MTILERLHKALRAALMGWIAAFLVIAPFQIVQACRSLGWKSASSNPAFFAEMLIFSLLLWVALSLSIASFSCGAFLFPFVWLISPETVVRHRMLWIAFHAAFGSLLMILRLHIWTALDHDGVGFTNFRMWIVYAMVFFGMSAELYYREARRALASR